MTSSILISLSINCDFLLSLSFDSPYIVATQRYFEPGFMRLWKFDVLTAGGGQEPWAVGHIMELCPQTNLMVGVYLAAALFFKQL